MDLMLKIRTDEILAVENANAKKRERERGRHEVLLVGEVLIVHNLVL